MFRTVLVKSWQHLFVPYSSCKIMAAFVCTTCSRLFCKMTVFSIIFAIWNIWIIFPYIGNKHPNWLIFFRGVGIPPTRSCLVFKSFSFHFKRSRSLPRSRSSCCLKIEELVLAGQSWLLAVFGRPDDLGNEVKTSPKMKGGKPKINFGLTFWMIAGNSEVKPVASHGMLLGFFFVVLPHGLASYQHCGEWACPTKRWSQSPKTMRVKQSQLFFGVVQTSWENWLRSAEFFWLFPGFSDCFMTLHPQFARND